MKPYDEEEREYDRLDELPGGAEIWAVILIALAALIAIAAFGLLLATAAIRSLA